MDKDIQVIVRFSPADRKTLRQAKNKTGMSERAIILQAFAQWWKQKRKELRTAG